MSAPSPRWGVRIYGAALRLFPREFRQRYGREMLLLFSEMWGEAASTSARLRLLLRSLSRVPPAAVGEWLRVVRAVKWGIPTGLALEVRQSARSLRRAPVFSLTTVLLIALGVGSVTAVFTVVNHVLLRPLPYPEAERLVYVGDGEERREVEAHAGPVLQRMQEIAEIDGWAIATSDAATLRTSSGADRVMVATVSGDFFRLFEGQPTLGRLLSGEAADQGDAVVVSHGAWVRLFGEDPGLLGRTVSLDGQLRTVVGVLSPTFQPPRALVPDQVDVWQPIDWTLAEHQRIDSESLEAVARLAPGVSRPQAQVAFDALARALADEFPDRYVDDAGVADPLPLVGLHEATVQPVRGGLLLLLGAVGLLLLVACLNVAQLVLARGESRVQEMAVRRALGASVPGLVRHLLVESGILGLAGGILGVGVAAFALRLLLRISPIAPPVGGEIALDGLALLFAAGVVGFTVLTFGTLPALRSAGSDHATKLRGARSATDSLRTTRHRRVLVVAEVALSVVLVAHAGLLARSLWRVQAHDPGLDAGNLVTVPLIHTSATSGSEMIAAMEEVRREVEKLPQVSDAAFGINLPFEVTGIRRSGWNNDLVMVARGEVQAEVQMRLKPVTTTYFRTLGIPLLGGGVWEEPRPAVTTEEAAAEDPAPLPVVLSRRTAEAYFGEAELAVGQHLWRQDAPARVWRVTGVAEDVRHWGLDQDVPHAAYLPIDRMPQGFRRVHMAVRTRPGGQSGLASAIRDVVGSVAPDVPVATVRPMREWIDASTARRRFDSGAFALFGAVGLLLATTGLYGTLLYHVRQRRRDLGIRMALGATPARIQRDVVGSGVRLSAVGLLLGLGLALLSARGLADRLYETTTLDPVALLGAGAVLLSTALVASWLPARSAARVQPVEVLGAE